MIAKTEVLNQINALLNYSITQKPQYQSQYTALTQPLLTAVDTYFDTVPEGMIEALENYVFQTYCDIHSRSIVYEYPVEGASFPTDYPEGYNDIRLCFYQFPLLNVTPEQFDSTWVIGVPEGEDDSEGGSTQAPEPISNTYIDLWTAEITAAPKTDVDNIKAVNEWCETNAGSLNLIHLLEDQGRILQSSGTQSVANTIYNEHHLLEVLQSRGYNVYIPTYLKKGGN